MIGYREISDSTHSVPSPVPYVPDRASPFRRALLRFTSNFGVTGCFATGASPRRESIQRKKRSVYVVSVRIEMPPRSRHVRRGHPAQEAQQALFANRAERVPVEVEDVDVAHLQARLRRRQTERGRDIGQRPILLAARSPASPGRASPGPRPGADRLPAGAGRRTRRELPATTSGECRSHPPGPQSRSRGGSTAPRRTRRPYPEGDVPPLPARRPAPAGRPSTRP